VAPSVVIVSGILLLRKSTLVGVFITIFVLVVGAEVSTVQEIKLQG